MIVVRFARWKKPQEVILYGGYFPHGRDYARERQVIYLGEFLRESFKTDTPTERNPDIFPYYSDVFGRRFVTKALWRKHVKEGPEEMSDPRFEFVTVDKDDHLYLPSKGQDVMLFGNPPQEFGSGRIEVPPAT